ncbi:ANTAR domain-containing response regulator [Aestuariivirga sp. YIM B02566]|uniref:ANTAR domain-containing protein n=1 Tax=Taklimakanibacter albus TaxID=2800327 RepID=A0ACC5R7C7_9HYPH|nr:ANTAR domain-containing protein [Aestuariivirga sp. YIM B02566]MBK1868510.1 ANTAR domain-containing protein [Aestuariivirga sp. YIM B02566]
MANLKLILDDLRQAKILVIHPRDDDGAALVDHLKRLGCDVKAVWPAPTAIPADTDAVFVQVGETSIEDLATLLETANTAVIAIVTYESPTSLKAVIDLNAHGVLTKPLRQLGVLTQFALARYRFSYEARLANKVKKLEETMKGRRTIEKAVKILTAMNGLEEEAAYKQIRDQATAKRVAVVSVAESIIAANEAMRAFGLKITKSEES